ncbi:MAG: HupE/UreJ family protein [Burkholderiaceae bacterium]
MRARARASVFRLVLVGLLWLLGPLLGSSALAHSTSTAYLDVDAGSPSAPAVRWRIALRDLDALLDLDSNGDGQLVWGEVEDRATDIYALAASRLIVSAGAPCAMRFTELSYARVADAGYAQLSGQAACETGRAVAVEYRLFAGVDPSHRVLLSVRGTAQPRILEPGATATITAAASDTQAPSGFAGFLLTGIAHIAGGFDHVLFLLCLLLPAVLQRRAGQWSARENVASALVAVIWIATAFTLAHSLTLALATFGVIRIPPRVIEPLIALTIVATALNNIWPVVTRRLAAVAFVFGLVHGFGFAEVLAPLALPKAELAVALLGFNLGVEIGQLAIVAGAFFVLATLRGWKGYPRWILMLGSALIAIIATIWLVERVFGVTILGF